MKKSLKLLVLPIATVLLASNLTSCGPSANVEIAMISDVGDIDDGGFNQGVWEAVQTYGKNHNKSYDYYRPFADSDFARKCSVKQAVTKGAKVILLPGFKFGDSAEEIATDPKNKDVKFVLIDFAVKNPPKNLICVEYNFAISGWLSGYAVAKDYFINDYEKDGKLKDNYGFGYYGGMSNPGVFPVGFGYIQGILYAAQEFTQEKGCNKPFINIEYDYAGVFMQDDMACIKAKGWLTNSDPKNNVKCIFSCGGKLYQSVTEAVNYYNDHFLPESERHFVDQEAPRNAARWIGVDGDQYHLLKKKNPDDVKSIYTSGLKDVGETVTVALDYYYNGCWDELHDKKDENPGKFYLSLDSKFLPNEQHDWDKTHSYVGIPDHTNSKGVLTGFKKFKQNDLYDAINVIKSGNVKLYSGFIDPIKLDEEEMGLPSCFNREMYYKSIYNNIYGTEEGQINKYELSNYIVHCPEPKK